jgi:uncharacterized alkaline shock family protein YloU
VSDWPFRRVEGDLEYGITQDALDGAAASAAAAVEGVEVASRRFARPRGRGAHVEVDAERVRARIEIACRYGTVVPQAAAEVQRRVAEALHTLTTLEVDAVDVDVVAVAR